MAAIFFSTDQDIREVMRTMLKSPEFWSPKAYRAKFKAPLEFVVSAVRASGDPVTAADSQVQDLDGMGMRPYGMEALAGYSMRAESWQSEGSLLGQINFSTALTQGKLAGVQFDPANLVTLGLLANRELSRTEALSGQVSRGLDQAVEVIEKALLNGDLSVQNQNIIRKQIEDPHLKRQLRSSPIDGLRQVVGFVLASARFSDALVFFNPGYGSLTLPPKHCLRAGWHVHRCGTESKGLVLYLA
jgi:hypothetical protein